MSFAGITSVLGTFQTGTYQVTRRAETTTADGRAQQASPSILTVDAVVMPLTGSDLQRLPEGERGSERRKVITKTPLKDVAEPDQISIENVMYEVETIESWTGFGDDFYKAIVRKVGER